MTSTSDTVVDFESWKRRKAVQGLPAPDQLDRIKAAMELKTPCGMRMAALCRLRDKLETELMGHKEATPEWLDAFGAIDAVGFSIGLLEVQIEAGNTEGGIWLPSGHPGYKPATT